MKRAESRRFWLGWCGVGLCWAAAFLALYFTLYAPQANSDYMIRFWRPAFLGSQANPWSAARVVIDGVLNPGFALDSQATFLIWAPGVLFGLGLIRAPFLAGAPLAGVIAAGLLGKWMFADRLMLFYLPLAALVIAAGAGRIASAVRRANLAWVALAAVLAAFPLKATAYVVRHPVRQDLRGAVRFAEARLQRTGAVYVYLSQPAWLFYTTDWKAPDAERLRWHKRLFQAFDTITGNVTVAPRDASAELARYWPGRGWEIAGLGDGIFRSAAGPPDRPPEQRWVDLESARITEVADRGAVLLGLAVGKHGFPELVKRFRPRVAEDYSAEMVHVVVLKAAATAPTAAPAR